MYYILYIEIWLSKRQGRKLYPKSQLVLVFFFQLLYIHIFIYIYSRILRTFVNISSAKEEKVRRSFFRKDLLYFSFKLLSLFFFRTVLFKYDPGRRFTTSFFLNQTHKFCFLISPLPRLSRTKFCNCFLRMKKGIRFLLCIFTEWICYNES